MTDKLNGTMVEPVSGLTYRVQAARSGQGKAPCLILLHGVGANEMGFIDLARQMDPRLVWCWRAARWNSGRCSSAGFR